MNVILLEPVKKLGYVGEVVTVKPGFARNFLIPQGLALPATVGNMKALEARIRAREKQLERERAGAQKLAEVLKDLVVYLKAKAGEGKIFGAITHAHVVEAIKEQKGFDLDKKRFLMPKAIKELGEYDVVYKAHHDIEVTIKLSISAI